MSKIFKFFLPFDSIIEEPLVIECNDLISLYDCNVNCKLRCIKRYNYCKLVDSMKDELISLYESGIDQISFQKGNFKYFVNIRRYEKDKSEIKK